MNDEISIDDYSDLTVTGYESREPTKPEEEFFHSVYISGRTRKNHIGITEEIGKFQIRGVEYNLNEVNMVITNVKEVLVRITRNKEGRESVDCFSYKTGTSWKGTTGRTCGINSAERAANDYCNLCRSQIIVSGVYCNTNGSPVLQEGKPIFVFIRGKGTKYSNVSNYLNDMFKIEDLDPIFEPITEESQKFERTVVNNKRFVTNISVGETSTSFGPKAVFELKVGEKLSKKAVIGVLKVSKQTLGKFNEKFDWSKRVPSTTGYTEEAPSEIPEDQQFPTTSEETEGEKQESEQIDGAFDFDGVKF